MFIKLFGDVKGIFNIITIWELLVNIIFILLGIIFFVNDNLSNVMVSMITGLSVIISGATSIYAYLKKGGIVLFNNNLIYGIAIIIIGIVMMLVGKMLSIFLGIYLIVGGVQKINYGIVLKRFNESAWLIILISGILYISIAITSFFTSSDNMVKIAGILLTGYGFINCINVLLLRRRSNYFLA